MSSKVKVVKNVFKDEGLADIMNQMMGIGDLNLDIVVPKYILMYECLSKLTKINDILINTPIWENKLYTYEGVIEEVEKMIEFNHKSQELVDGMSGIVARFEKCVLSPNNVSKELRDEFTASYEAVKKSAIIGQYLSACDALIVYEPDLKKNTPNNPQYKWILTIPGVSFCPLSFCNIDFKQIVTNIIYERDQLEERASSETEEAIRSNQSMLKLVTIFLSRFLEISYGLYKALTSPDIDVSEFADLIMENIGAVKKQIPRCDKAFNKIKESVNLLKTNFDSYYKDFLESKNPGVIMQNFVLDISKDVKADAELARQFKEIVKFYEKNSAGIKDPKLKFLIDKAKGNLSGLDNYYNINKTPKPE